MKRLSRRFLLILLLALAAPRLALADSTLPNLPSASAASGTDLVPTTQGGNMLKQTLSAIATYFWSLVGGDCTAGSGGSFTCTKTNGTAFAPSATTDTTNASNISSGTLPAARLPSPSASTLGGVESIAQTAHEWIDSISTAGVPHQSQPGASDISGLGTIATQAASNVAITGGTINGTSVGATTASSGAFTTLSASGVLTTSSGRVVQIRVVTASGAVTIATTDYIVVVDKTTGSATTVNLPSSPATGTVLFIKDGKGDAGTNNITITPASGTIDGASSYVISTNYGAAMIVFNGTQWNVI